MLPIDRIYQARGASPKGGEILRGQNLSVIIHIAMFLAPTRREGAGLFGCRLMVCS